MQRLFALCVCLALAACGGSPSSAPPAVATLSGLAATGSAIAGRITLKDAASNEQFVDTVDGTYSFTLTDLTPPYMLKAQWSVSGTPHTLYSFASGEGTANITPLTHMAVASAAGVDDLDSVYADASTFGTISSGLPAAIATLQQSLLPLLTQYGVSSLDPISGAFAADHTGMDDLLDHMTVSYNAGNVTITDTVSGAILLDSPIAELSHALAVPDWSAQDAAAASDPALGVDPSGNALVAWTEVVASHWVVRTRFLTGDSAAAFTVSTSGEASLPRLAFDGTGNAMLVWAQWDSSRNDIFASHYSAATNTWSTPVRVSSPSAVDSAYAPDVAVDASGNAIVTWYQGDGRVNHFDAWAAQFNASTGAWSAAALVSDGVNSAYLSRVAINAAGQGIVAWEQGQDDGTMVSNGPKDIWGRSVTSAGAWGASTRLNAVTGDINDLYGQVAVAVDAQGNGFALWVQSTSTLPYVIHAARYATGGAWAASTVITSDTIGNCYGPHLAFDATGNAVAVWQQQTGAGAFGGANRYVAGSGWGVSESMASDTLGDVYDPHVAVDGEGNATAVWYRWGPTDIVDVMTNRYLVGSGWGVERLLSTTPPENAFGSYPVPRVAANAAGQTVAVWGTNSY